MFLLTSLAFTDFSLWSLFLRVAIVGKKKITHLVFLQIDLGARVEDAGVGRMIEKSEITAEGVSAK